jgi:hypothetical protein
LYDFENQTKKVNMRSPIVFDLKEKKSKIVFTLKEEDHQGLPFDEYSEALV